MVKHLLIRIEMDDYDRWLATHYQHAEDRQSYGMVDGPVYRDIDNANAAMFHIRTENLERAMQWFSSDVFKEASRRATVRDREFYLADSRATANSPVTAGS
jgi:hypothetical protein